MAQARKLLGRGSHEFVATLERRLCRRNRFLGGGFGRGAKPPSEVFQASVSITYAIE